MNESFWGIFVISLGIVILSVIFLFQSLTNNDEHNYNLLRETTEAAMRDAIDMNYYNETSGQLKIQRDKFVESFVRRFANNANLSRNYRIEIYDINEEPPKVSLKVSATGILSSDRFNDKNGIINFELSNSIDAILENEIAN